MSATNQSISLITEDSYTLQGFIFPAKKPVKAKLIVAGATAVPQGFYRRFAQYCADQGYETLTFDYRGIGLSRPEQLKGFRMSLLDWGQKDLAAAVSYMHSEDVPLFLVGHSYGGHALGLLPNHDLINGFYVFGTSAGWHGYMPKLERLKVQIMWRTLLPALTLWKGYCPWKMLGLGEDLPLDVFRQWRHWCQFPRYFFDDPAMQGIEQSYAAVTTPIYAVNALDDLWAMPASRDAFLQAYTNATIEREDLDPKNYQGKVGHMGYFREHASPMWDDALTWFEQLKGQYPTIDRCHK